MRSVVRRYSEGQFPGVHGNLFGRDSDASKAARPAQVVLPSGRAIVQVPISVLPGLRTPLHPSIEFAARQLSPVLSSSYQMAGDFLLDLLSDPWVLLVHPIDLIDARDVPQLHHVPGMRVPHSRKVEIILRRLQRIGQSRSFVSMQDYVRSMAN